jgi:hypothetical protein
MDYRGLSDEDLLQRAHRFIETPFPALLASRPTSRGKVSTYQHPSSDRSADPSAIREGEGLPPISLPQKENSGDIEIRRKSSSAISFDKVTKWFNIPTTEKKEGDNEP